MSKKIVFDILSLQVNGNSIDELIDFDPDLDCDEFAALVKERSFEMRKLKLLDWDKKYEDELFEYDDFNAIQVSSIGTLGLRAVCSGRSTKLSIYVPHYSFDKKTIEFVPPIKLGSTANQLRKELGWDKDEVDVFSNVLTKNDGDLRLSFSIRKPKDASISVMRHVKH